MKNLLVAIDFSKTTDAVLDQAALVAKALGARLWVLHVTSDETRALMFEATRFSGYSSEFGGDVMPVITPEEMKLADEMEAEENRREHAELQDITSHLRDQGVDARGVLAEGDPGKRIVEKAGEFGADIIILGSHGHGALHKALLGSVSEAVIKHAPCNVMLVPAREE